LHQTHTVVINMSNDISRLVIDLLSTNPIERSNLMGRLHLLCPLCGFTYFHPHVKDGDDGDDHEMRITIECECENGCEFDILISNVEGMSYLGVEVREDPLADAVTMLCRAGLVRQTADDIVRTGGVEVAETFLARALLDFPRLHHADKRFSHVGHLLNNRTFSVRNGARRIEDILPDEDDDIVEEMRSLHPEFFPPFGDEPKPSLEDCLRGFDPSKTPPPEPEFPSWDEIDEIRNLRQSGMSFQKISEKTGWSKHFCKMICDNPKLPNRENFHAGPCLVCGETVPLKEGVVHFHDDPKSTGVRKMSTFHVECAATVNPLYWRWFIKPDIQMTRPDGEGQS